MEHKAVAIEKVKKPGETEQCDIGVRVENVSFIVRNKHNQKHIIAKAVGHHMDYNQLVVGKTTLAEFSMSIPTREISNPQLRKAIGKNNCLNMKVEICYLLEDNGNVNMAIRSFKFDGLDDVGRGIRWKTLNWFIDRFEKCDFKLTAWRSNENRRRRTNKYHQTV